MVYVVCVMSAFGLQPTRSASIGAAPFGGTVSNGIAGRWCALVALLMGGASAVQAQCPADGPPTVSGDVSLTGDVVRSSLNEDKLGANGQVTFRFGAHESLGLCTTPYRLITQMGTEYRRRRTAKETSFLRNHRFEASLLRSLTSDWFVSSSAQWYHNNLQGIQLQQAYRLVAGRTLGWAELSAGPALLVQDFGTEEESRSFAAISIRETGLVPLVHLTDRHQIKLQQSVRFTQPTDEPEARQITASAVLSIPIIKSIKVTWSGWYDYFDNAPTGRERSYLSTTFGLGFEF
jgi:hypothetical protein